MAQLLKNIRGHQAPLKQLLSAKKNNHLPHALLFTGPSGIGKEKVAWALAQSLLCEEQSPACGKCAACLKVEQRNNLNVLYIEPEGLYIKVDAIRYISRFVSLQSFSPARVVIIASAHLMNLQAANSLLKILEEPPENIYFILVSSHLSALPVTIRSRVQTLRFLPLSVEELQEEISLKENSQKKEKGKDKETASSNNLMEKWMVQAAHGRLDEWEKWQENKEIRKQAFELLKKAVLVQDLFSFESLSDLVKKREQALFVCLCWQQVLRDACMRKLKSQDIIHRDQEELLNALGQLSSNTLDDFFQKTVEMENDLKRYVDALLVFDNVFLYIREKQKENRRFPPSRG